MTLDRRPFTPQSFSRIPFQKGRALSNFVALSAWRDGGPTSPSPFYIVGFGISLVGIWTLPVSLGQLLFWITAASFLALFVVGHLANRGQLFSANPDQRRTMARRKLVHRLNTDRARVGLEAVIEPNTLASLEESAQAWEKIDHSLVGASWATSSELKAGIEKRAYDSMLSILSYSMGSAIAEGMTADQMHVALLRERAYLTELSISLSAAQTADSPYPRESGLSMVSMGLGSSPEAERLRFLVAEAPVAVSED